MVPDESEKRRLVDVAPAPFRLERRDRLGRAWQELSGVAAGCVRRAEPVAGDDAEISTATAGVRPPELAVRVRRVARCDDAVRPSAGIDGDHLDGVQVIRRETELTTQKAEGTTHDMPTHADRRILAERDHHAPPVVQHAERVADCGAGLDGNRTASGVVVNALHGRDIDDHPHVRVRDEPLEAVPAAGDDETSPFLHRVFDGRHDLFGRAHESHVVRRRAEPLVEPLVDHGAIPRVVGADLVGCALRVVDALPYRHHLLSISLDASRRGR